MICRSRRSGNYGLCCAYGYGRRLNGGKGCVWGGEGKVLGLGTSVRGICGLDGCGARWAFGMLG